MTVRIRDRLQGLRRRAVAVITSPDVSIWQVIGGGWGLVDVFGPHVIFVVAYLVSDDIVVAIGIALVAALTLVIARLATGQAIRKTLGGALLVGVSGLIALATGQDSDFYLLPVIRSLVLAVLVVASMAVGRPLVGLIVGPVIGGTAWRRDRVLLNAYMRCTAIWAVVAVVRAGVQLPLYASDSVVGLGVAHLVTGIPLFAVMVYWQLRILRRAYAVAA